MRDTRFGSERVQISSNFLLHSKRDIFLSSCILFCLRQLRVGTKNGASAQHCELI